jgi:hypothetical protein
MSATRRPIRSTGLTTSEAEFHLRLASAAGRDLSSLPAESPSEGDADARSGGTNDHDTLGRSGRGVRGGISRAPHRHRAPPLERRPHGRRRGGASGRAAQLPRHSVCGVSTPPVVRPQAMTPTEKSALAVALENGALYLGHDRERALKCGPGGYGKKQVGTARRPAGYAFRYGSTARSSGPRSARWDFTAGIGTDARSRCSAARP